MRANDWSLRTIEQHRHHLTRQQFKTLMGQAKAGNPDASMKGLEKIMRKERAKNGRD